jgi:hypothetical protein
MSVAETQMDLDRITHPLRLAKGSHQPGSGKGCAMNVSSYINSDTHITGFPASSARPLAILVQASNDLLAGPDSRLISWLSFHYWLVSRFGFWWTLMWTLRTIVFCALFVLRSLGLC